MPQSGNKRPSRSSLWEALVWLDRCPALGIVPNLAVAVFFADTIVNRLPGSGTLLPWDVVGGMPALVTVLRAASLLAFAGPNY